MNKKDYQAGKMLVKREFLEDIIIDALEGSIGYWGLIHNDTDEWNKYKDTELTLGEKAVKIIFDNGKSIKITDNNREETPVYELSLERFLEGINLNSKHRTWDSDLEGYDAVTCDCIIQYAIFNDVIFG